MRFFGKNLQVLWAHSPKPEYELDDDWADQWYIPARVIALVRPGQDYVILPGQNQQLKDYFEFCCQILGIREWQAIWTSGQDYLLDHGIDRELAPMLGQLLGMGDWVIAPYSVTRPFMLWALQYGVKIIGDNESWVSTYSNKGILHPNILNGSNPRDLPYLPDLVPGLQVARGFYCSDSNQQLMDAYLELRKQGVDSMLIKPVTATTGEGITVVPDLQFLSQYQFPMGGVILEEQLTIDHNQDGQIIAPAIQYDGMHVYPDIVDQTFQGMAFEGNALPSKTSLWFQAEMKRQTRNILQAIRPKGPGGFDFLSVKRHPVLVDNNTGRFNGAHPPRIFHHFYAPRTSFASWKISPKISVWEFWERLGRKNLQFIPGKTNTGIFPLCFLPEMWGMLIAFASSRQELNALRAQATECLEV